MFQKVKIKSFNKKLCQITSTLSTHISIHSRSIVKQVLKHTWVKRSRHSMALTDAPCTLLQFNGGKSCAYLAQAEDLHGRMIGILVSFLPKQIWNQTADNGNRRPVSRTLSGFRTQTTTYAFSTGRHTSIPSVHNGGSKSIVLFWGQPGTREHLHVN